METLVPFLVAQADVPVEDDQHQVETNSEAVEKNAPSWGIFHTRCGHPRRRDD